MVSFNVYKATSSGAYVEGVCLATDEKPVVGIANGSILFAVDTSTGETTRYMYDQESMSWIEAECPCAGGGSGGSGGGDSGGGGEGPLLVELSGSSSNRIANKTFQEIHDALESGRGAVVTSIQGKSGQPWYPFIEVGMTLMDWECRYLSRSGSNVVIVSSANSGGTGDAGADDYPRFTSGV